MISRGNSINSLGNTINSKNSQKSIKNPENLSFEDLVRQNQKLTEFLKFEVETNKTNEITLRDYKFKVEDLTLLNDQNVTTIRKLNEKIELLASGQVLNQK